MKGTVGMIKAMQVLQDSEIWKTVANADVLL